MAVSLRAFYHVTVSGEPESVYGTARALVASLAALHSPEDLVIAVAAGRERGGALGVGEVAAARAGSGHRRTGRARGG